MCDNNAMQRNVRRIMIERSNPTLQSVSHIFAVNASHIRAYLSRRRISGRKASRSGARAASVSTRQKRCVAGTRRLPQCSIVIAAEEFRGANTTPGDKRWLPVSAPAVWILTQPEHQTEMLSFLGFTFVTGKHLCGSLFTAKMHETVVQR